MKPTLIFPALLSAVLVTGVLTAVPAAANGDCTAYSWSGGAGDGSASNPYKVASQEDLEELQYCMNKSFVQTADIALSGNWLPLRTNPVTSFSGTYDGKDRTISGLTITEDSLADVGLFAAIWGGTVKNLNLKGVNIHRTDIVGATISHVGGLAGYIEDASIENVTVSGVVDALHTVGLLTGLVQDSTLKNITVSGQVGDVVLKDSAGGIAGEVINSQASHLRSSAAVRVGSAMGEGENTYGGAFGKVRTEIGYGLTPTSIDDVISTGAVSGRGTIGGAIGSVNGADINGPVEISITRVHASGAVTASGGPAGGAIGEIIGGAGKAMFSQLSSSGAVSGSSSVGGLIGDVTSAGYGTQRDVTISNSYATGKVTAASDDGGGLIGSVSYIDGFAVSNSYSASSVTSLNGSGPIINSFVTSTGAVSNSFWNPTSSGLASSAFGTELTQTAMKTVTPYADAGWKIVDGWAPSGEAIWGICSAVNGGYPFLLWTQDTDPCTLSAPTELSVVAGSTTATATWKAPSDAAARGLTGYEYRLGSEGAWVATGSAATTLTLTGLTNGTTYSISVRGMDDTRPGKASDPVSFTPSAATQNITPAPKWPKTLLHPGRTVVFKKWMVTNAGQRVRPSATCTLVRSLRPFGDTRFFSTTLTKKGKFIVQLNTAKPVRVRILLTAKGTEKYAPLKQSKVYRLR